MSVGPGSGYGYAAESYLSGLRDAGMPISWTPLGWPSNVWNAPFGPVANAELDGALHRDIADADIAHDTVVVHSVPVWHERFASETSGKLRVAFTTAASTGGRNELCEFLQWCQIIEGLSRSTVEASLDVAKVGGGLLREVGALG